MFFFFKQTRFRNYRKLCDFYFVWFFFFFYRKIYTCAVHIVHTQHTVGTYTCICYILCIPRTNPFFPFIFAVTFWFLYAKCLKQYQILIFKHSTLKFDIEFSEVWGVILSATISMMGLILCERYTGTCHHSYIFKFRVEKLELQQTMYRCATQQQ